MRRFITLLMAAGLAAPVMGGAQVVRVQRPSDAWLNEAPRVRVWLEHPAPGIGRPVQVNLELSDDAYVVVGHVERHGRLTILYPQGPTRRSHLAGGMVHRITGRSQSTAAFYTTEWGSGYVFAIASYAPLDLTGFESRDFRPGWTDSRFTLASRTLAPDPDEYVPAFAQAVLWDGGMPYEYDVAYYTAFGGSAYASRFALCDPEFRFYLRDAGLSAPLYSYCRSLYYQYQCLSWSALMYSPHAASCLRYLPAPRLYAQGPPVPGTPSAGDSGAGPNETIIRNGLWRPDTASRNADPSAFDGLHVARSAKDDANSDANAWDRLYAIPAGARQKLKGNDEPAAVTDRTVPLSDQNRPIVQRANREAPPRAKPSRRAQPDRVDATRTSRPRYDDRVRRPASSKPPRADNARPAARERPSSSSSPTIRATKPTTSKPTSSGSSSKTKPPK